ncbi:transglycosylase SLT domain-containing protein [Rhodococcus sp. JT-3]|uniref:transglycosylase SLT domain-containing protein n=1 Tax=Rhodococcus sp. JT-3 TaxID=1973213 RepID=UPI0013030D7F|nr:transglycosylase SLT domain-containing protein [Rhodococcus sp. JT-3]
MTAPYAKAVVTAELDWGNVGTEFEARVRVAAEKAAKAAQKQFDRVRLAAKVSFRADVAEFRRETQERLDRAAFSASVVMRADTSKFHADVRKATKNLPGAKVEVTPEVKNIQSFVQGLEERLRVARITAPVFLAVANEADFLARIATLTRPVTQTVNIITTGDTNGPGGGPGSGGRNGGLRGGMIRRIRMQIEMDRSSVASAEAQIAALETRLSAARTRQSESIDRVRVAQARLDEVNTRANSTASQRLAAHAALTRANNELGSHTARVTQAIGDQAEAHQRLRRAQQDQNSVSRIARAAIGGLAETAMNLGRNLLSSVSPAGLLKVALLALAALSLVPLLGQLAQAAGIISLLPAVAASAVAGIATMVIGFTGVFDAFSQGSKAAEIAAKGTAAAAKQQEADARKRAQAAKAVASAERGVESALDGVDRAERGVTQSQRQAEKGQESLNRAREEAKATIDDLNFALKGTAIDERDAVLALARAREAYDKTFADPAASALDRSEAALGVDKALRRQEEVGRRNTQLAKDAAKANEKGIEGSDQVVAAKEAVAEADQGIVDANKAVVDAQEQVTLAQQNLIDAQDAAAEAMTSNADAVDEYADALANLSPNARAFVEQVRGLSDVWKELRLEVQDNLFAGMGDSIVNLANNYLPLLKTGLGGIATEINGGIRRAIDDMSSDSAKLDWTKILENTRASIGPVIDGLSDLAGALTNIAAIGSEFLPGFSNSFAETMQEFREWTESEEGENKIRNFMEKSIESLKQVKDLFLAVGDVIGGLSKTSEKTGKSMIESMTESLRDFAKWMETPAGQDKMQSFWQTVKDTVSDILKLVETALDLAGELFKLGQGLGLIAEVEKRKADRQGVTPTGVNSADETRGTGGKVLGNALGSKDGSWWGQRFRDSEGRTVDEDGNELKWQNNVIVGFPGYKKGSGAERIVSGVMNATPLGLAFQGLGKLFGNEVNPKAVPEGTRNAGLRSVPGYGYMPGPGNQGRGAGGAGGAVTKPGPNDTIDMPNPYGKGGMRKPMTKAEWMSFFEPGTEAAADAEAEFDETWARENVNTQESLDEQKGFFGNFGSKVSGVFSGIVDGDMPNFLGGLGGTLSNVFSFDTEGSSAFSRFGSNAGQALFSLATGDFTGFTSSLGELGRNIFGTTEDGKINFDGLRTKIGEVVGDIVGRLFPGLKPGLDKVVQWVSETTSSFGGIWDGLKAAAAGPINWIIDHVINGALKSAWDGLKGILPGLPDWNGVDRIEVSGSGKGDGPELKQKFYKGGVAGIMPGYTPGRDPFTIGVSGGEAIMRPEWTRAMGPDYVHEMNAIARTQGIAGVRRQAGYFSQGGIVDNLTSIMAEKYPMLTMTSGYRTTDNGYHSRGMAADFSNGGIEGTPEMKSASQWWYENFGSTLRELIHMPFNNNVKDGQNVGNGMSLYGEGTMLEHRHHLHVATDRMLNGDGTSSPAEPGFLDRVKNAVGDAVNVGRNALAGQARNMIAKPFDAVKSLLPDFGPSGFAQIPNVMIDTIRNAVTSKALGLVGLSGSSDDAGTTPWDLGAGVEQWRGKVIEALEREGFDSGIRNQNLMLAQIMSESSGNPNAIQQVQDVNSGGNEAVGLLQVIPGTFASHRNPNLPNDRTNPDASMSAALRWYRHAYGDDLGAMWGQGHGYDQGGIANGIGVMPKFTLQPERVLSPEMTADFERLISVLERPDFIDVLRQITSDAVTNAATAASVSSGVTAPAPEVSIAASASGPSTAFDPNNTGYDDTYYNDTVARGGVEGANAWLARQDFGPQIRTWGINALKEIGGEFASPLGLERRWGEAVDQGAANAMRAANSGGGDTYNITQEFHGYNGTPQQFAAEMERAARQGLATLTPV